MHRFVERQTMCIVYKLDFFGEHYELIEQRYYLLRCDASAAALRALDERKRKRKPCKWSRIVCSELRISSNTEVFPLFTLTV